MMVRIRILIPSSCKWCVEGSLAEHQTEFCVVRVLELDRGAPNPLTAFESLGLVISVLAVAWSFCMPLLHHLLRYGR